MNHKSQKIHKGQKIGLFIGRFQPFHLIHLQIVRDALKEVDKLIIVIGSSRQRNSFTNPFTFKERARMIRESTKNLGSRVRIRSIADVRSDKKWMKNVLKKIPRFNYLFSGNDLVVNLFRENELHVKNISLIKPYCGTFIRKLMVRNDNFWKRCVPRQVIKIIEEIHGVGRVRKAFEYNNQHTTRKHNKRKSEHNTMK